MNDRKVDQESIQCLRRLIRSNFVARDELYAAARALDDEMLAEICRRLADDLGGNAADLQQLLAGLGAEPAEPDRVARRLHEIVMEMLEQRQGQASVIAEAEAAEHQLREVYDEVIAATPDDQVEGLLKTQREDVVFGEKVLHKVKEADEEPKA